MNMTHDARKAPSFVTVTRYRNDFLIAETIEGILFRVYDNELSDPMDPMHVARSMQGAKDWIDGLCGDDTPTFTLR